MYNSVNYQGQVGQALGQDYQSPNVGANPPVESMQSLSQENAGKLKTINQRLAALRARLFGECEITKDAPPSPANMPMSSLQGSISRSTEEIMEAIRQLDSITSRL